MRSILKYGFLVAIFTALAVTGYSDTLILKNGQRISGFYEGGSSRVIRFTTSTGVQEYDLLSVAGIEFGADVVSSAPVIDSPPAIQPSESGVRSEPLNPVDEPVRLQSREESATRPASASAANTAWTVPTGSALLIRIVEGIDSETDAVGKVFSALLEEPLVVENIEVAPRGSEVRGRISQVQGAGRVRGSAELQLELTQIVVNGIPYAVSTSEYEEVAESRGQETARRVGAGAGVGALIGLIAGGGRGAAIGAGVGAGATGAVQVLTKGEQLYIPAETLLGFELSEPLIIAGR